MATKHFIKKPINASNNDANIKYAEKVADVADELADVLDKLPEDIINDYLSPDDIQTLLDAVDILQDVYPILRDEAE